MSARPASIVSIAAACALRSPELPGLLSLLSERATERFWRPPEFSVLRVSSALLTTDQLRGSPPREPIISRAPSAQALPLSPVPFRYRAIFTPAPPPLNHQALLCLVLRTLHSFSITLSIVFPLHLAAAHTTGSPTLPPRLLSPREQHPYPPAPSPQMQS